MKKALLLLAAASLAAPAAAQQAGHTMPGHTMPAPKKAAPKKKPVAKKAAPKKAATKKAATKKAVARKPAAKKPAVTKPATTADPHAGHSISPQQQMDPHAGHQMPAEQQAQPVDPHAGHQMPAQQQPGPHAGHDMGPMAGPQPQPGPPPAEALSGPQHAADAYWGQAMGRARNILREEHGGMPAYKLFVDRAETRVREGRDGYLFDAQAWYGGDINKLWLKSEVEGPWGEKLEHAEVQALWSHAIGPWFDLQAGARFDPQPGPNRTYLVLGVEGLAPYWWEVEGALFLSKKGDITARAEAEYDLRITQKLILQPRAEINLSLQDVPEISIGSGLIDASLGIRLRYQFSPLVAPYIGVEYEQAFGKTRRFLRAEDEDPAGFNLLAGVRLWF